MENTAWRSVRVSANGGKHEDALLSVTAARASRSSVSSPDRDTLGFVQNWFVEVSTTNVYSENHKQIVQIRWI